MSTEPLNERKAKLVREQKQDPRDPREGLKSNEQLAMEERARGLQQDVWAMRDFIRMKMIIEIIVLAALFVFVGVVKHTIDVNHGTGTDNHQILCVLIKEHQIHEPTIDRICGFVKQ